MLKKATEVRFYVVMDSKVNADGLSKVYLRFFTDGKKKDYFTGIKWPRDRFDSVNELLIPRYIQDPDYSAHNMKIGQYKTIVHQVKLDAFVKGKELHIQHLIDSLNKLTPFTDFITFATEEGKRLVRTHVFTYETWRRHKVAINKVAEFFKKDIVGIDEITVDTIQQFDAHYRRLKKAHNTITGYHKDIKGYLNKAIAAGLLESNPYDKFKFKYVDGEREALTQDEVKTLMKLFRSNELETTDQEILRRFLFSCLTGIRISDTHLVKSSDIKFGNLVLKPKKGTKFGKMVKLPLPEAAKSLIEGREGLLFGKATDQHINRTLKVLAAHAGIKKRLTYHCARDTFGTIFIELGGDIKSLCDLMGHSSTRITEIYLKMADKRKVQLMNNFDTMFA